MDSDYWTQKEKNSTQAEEIIKSAFPDLWELHRLMNQFNITYDELLDYIYNVRFVKNHGYGNITTVIYDKHITKIEGLIRTIKHIEYEKKK